MSARGRFLSGLITTAITLAGFATVGALPAAANTGTVWYVALGDSYAAGQGAPPYFNEACKRSAKGYPALLDAQGKIRLVANQTCTGATTEDVTDSQLSALNRGRTKLVTLTVGANDLDVSSLATLCTTPGMLEDCLAAIEVVRRVKLPALAGDLTDLFADVADAAPKARIVVTGYPHLVEPTAPFDPSLIAALNAATDALNSTIAEAVDAADPIGDNIVYVDVTGAFEGHGIGGTEPPPFINAPPSPDAFHPTADGYAAYAGAISAELPAAWLDEQQQLV